MFALLCCFRYHECDCSGPTLVERECVFLKQWVIASIGCNPRTEQHRQRVRKADVIVIIVSPVARLDVLCERSESQWMDREERKFVSLMDPRFHCTTTERPRQSKADVTREHSSSSIGQRRHSKNKTILNAFTEVDSGKPTFSLSNEYQLRYRFSNFSSEEMLYTVGDTLPGGYVAPGRGVPVIDFLPVVQKATTVEHIVEFFKRENSSWTSVQTSIIDNNFVE
ncbi:LOW QUALITY PROTEIN: Hypothetical protein PHPALM_7173 [Phytophthora palmivora]|uniref:Uncharacterized protein n=1 Tax=Phytophthora palmivora TaxID=4796 RepID=A0A2P4YD00_9STRA|nr:LOW QUALITY PROTEIN: Hypothetical protein PHPALM_7173 [Phytophthora palmivora]